MTSRLHALAMSLTCLLLAGCQQAPSTPPEATVAPAGDPRAEADVAAQRGDWETAVTRYAVALERDPHDVALRFAYGSALSQLDRSSETIEQFRWVVEHGDPLRTEVATARQWLQQAGVDTEGTASTPDTPTEAKADRPNASTAEASGSGTLAGRSSWPGVDANDRPIPLRLRVRGDEEKLADVGQRFSMRLGRPFTIPDLPAGRYRLIGESGDITLWDVPVTVEPGKTTSLDLSPSNSPIFPGDFPPGR